MEREKKWTGSFKKAGKMIIRTTVKVLILAMEYHWHSPNWVAYTVLSWDSKLYRVLLSETIPAILSNFLIVQFPSKMWQIPNQLKIIPKEWMRLHFKLWNSGIKSWSQCFAPFSLTIRHPKLVVNCSAASKLVLFLKLKSPAYLIKHTKEKRLRKDFLTNCQSTTRISHSGSNVEG